MIEGREKEGGGGKEEVDRLEKSKLAIITAVRMMLILNILTVNATALNLGCKSSLDRHFTQ